MRPIPTRPAPRHLLLAWALLAVQIAAAQPAVEADLTDRPVSEIRIEGLKRVSEQLVLNQLRSAVGDPYDPVTVSDDVKLLTRLGEFSNVEAEVELQRDGTVLLTYTVVEAPIIAEVQVIGNKLISDQELLAVVRITRGSPRDDFTIENAKRAIEAKYRERGHYLTTVTVDESELDETGILLFRVIEGPRVKVKAIEFEGNHAFSDKELHAEIETRTAIPLFRRGELDEERLVDDVATLDRFYKARGFLDVRVDRIVELSPDSTEAKVTFLIAEGRRYTLRSVRTEPSPLRVFSREQIETLLVILPGDVYSRAKVERSKQLIRDAYGIMGYLDVAVDATELRSSDEPEVDLLLEINEGKQYLVGTVEVTGNFLTADKVIRRQLRGMRPGHPFDAREVERAQRRIKETRLFTDVNITILDPDPADPDYRNVLVEVREANTGSVNFGIAAGSDSGFFGEFSLVQRNFDITDFPESPGELFSGRAFRGAGQRFSMVLRPGNELFQYSISWTEPHFLETDYALAVDGQYREREFFSSGQNLYTDERFILAASLGRSLGEFWSMAFPVEFQHVKLKDISPTAPVDVFAAAGPSNIGSVGIQLSRSTITTITAPDEGSRLLLALEQYGGDWTFTRAQVDYTVFLALSRDLLGRASTLKLSGRVGYLFAGNTPLYERFYLGGRSLRGFEFRTVSPKGVNLAGMQTTDPVGGDWMVFLGAQYEKPLIQKSVSAVAFIDSGTVTDTPGFDDYRVSVGVGLRIYVEAFGPVPIALDLAWPLAKQDDDETQIFSFSAELPF